KGGYAYGIGVGAEVVHGFAAFFLEVSLEERGRVEEEHHRGDLRRSSIKVSEADRPLPLRRMRGGAVFQRDTGASAAGINTAMGLPCRRIWTLSPSSTRSR